MKKTSILIILSIFLFAACNKKDKVMSKTDILTSGTWKITALVEDNDGNGSYETDAYALFQPCTKDDYYTFKSGGQLEMNEGPSKCDPADPQTDNVSWQFTSNETKINVDGTEYDIDALNNSTFRIKENYPGLYGAMLTFTKR